MKDPGFAKFVVFVNAAVPLAILSWDAYQGQLGANPVNEFLNTTGMLALVFLMLTLTVTPLRKLTGWNLLSHFRRMLGLFVFFYACVHFTTYFWLDRSLSISGTVTDVAKRPFILFGMLALLTMVPLAATSTNGMIKRLGAARWKRLHSLVYLTGIAAVIHYWMRVKADTRKPLAFAAVLGVLLAYRIIAGYLSQLRKSRIAEQSVSLDTNSGASILK